MARDRGRQQGAEDLRGNLKKARQFRERCEMAVPLVLGPPAVATGAPEDPRIFSIVIVRHDNEAAVEPRQLDAPVAGWLLAVRTTRRVHFSGPCRCREGRSPLRPSGCRTAGSLIRDAGKPERWLGDELAEERAALVLQAPR